MFQSVPTCLKKGRDADMDEWLEAMRVPVRRCLAGSLPRAVDRHFGHERSSLLVDPTAVAICA
jgi:hypothetical protein